MKAIKELAKIVSTERLAEGIYSMWVRTEFISSNAAAGQFVTVYPRDSSRLLPRPFSICEIDRERFLIRVVYRVVGEGTREMSGYAAGESINIMGPLGNGFTIIPAKSLLIGGGIGIPPMVELAGELGKICDVCVVAGYRDELFLTEELKRCSTLLIATEDGSAGTRGTVMDAICENRPEAEMIYACGPKPMLKAVKDYAEKQNIRAQLSLEEHMACGIGACLGCVCESVNRDPHSNVRNKRVCKDGPVFRADEVIL